MPSAAASFSALSNLLVSKAIVSLLARGNQTCPIALCLLATELQRVRSLQDSCASRSKLRAFPKGKAGGVWLLNVVLGSSWPSRRHVLESPDVQSGVPGLPSLADTIMEG